MSPKNPQAMRSKINVETGGTISLLAASLGKMGYFRNTLNACRVNKACRTVVTGNPYLPCRQCSCPQVIAEKIGIPIRANTENIDYLRTLIKNYPVYPCVLQVNKKTISEDNKDLFINQLQLGDVVFRQVIQNDICFANRYPSLREESIGSYNVNISQGQSVQFNMSVIKKMNADFDGDEMQLFFFPSPEDCIEAVLLASMYSQFIEYQQGLNIIGGAPDLGVALYQIKRLKLEKEIKLPKDINYNDDKLIIKKGIIQQIDKQIASRNSPFLQYIYNTYGATTAIQIIDTVIKYCYYVNSFTSESYYTNILYAESKNQDKIEGERIKKCNQLLEKYYDGTFETPIGVDKNLYFDQYLHATETYQEIIQTQLIEDQYTSKNFSEFYNQDIIANLSKLKTALVSVGQTPTRIQNSIRTFAKYPKFNMNIESEGYIRGCYINGLTQTEQFMDCFNGREQAYIKGNTTAKSGYMSRRINKGLDSIYCGFNGLIFGDNSRVIAYQFGQGFNPRNYQIVTVKYEDSTDKEYFKQLFGDSKEVKYQIPFKPEGQINKSDLNNILTCRITENMSDEFKEIIYSQAWQFYSYCRLTMEITKSQTHITEQYLKSIIPSGEPIGPKTALAITEPKTQELLNVIHAKRDASGNIQYINIDQVPPFQRFLELSQAQNTYTQFECQFISNSYDELIKFMQDNQTLSIKQLNPQYNLYMNSNIHLEISFNLIYLETFNVSIQKLLEVLCDYYETNKYEISKKKDAVIIEFQFSLTHSTEQLFYKTQQDIKFGSGYLWNLYYDQQGDKYILKGNINSKYTLELYKNRLIDPTSIKISDVIIYKELFGIQAAKEKLFEAYNENKIQINFFELLAYAQTFSGDYTGFSRNHYFKQPDRDFVSNIIYEQGSKFLQQASEKTKWYKTQTFQNASMFNRKAAAGSDVSEIFI